MEIPYLPLEERTPDHQYLDRLFQIRNDGVLAKDTPQGVGAITCFGTLAPMVFDYRNGFPLITERNCKGFWTKPIAEIIAFLNGARTIDEIESYGCKGYWSQYRGKGTQLGLEPDDMGPGSYGPAFTAFEVPDGSVLNQFEQVLQQLRDFPTLRSHLITPWKPYYTARGARRKVMVAPCHGWLHFRALQGKLHMRMDQRSADFPIGVPSNMIQYAALHLMMCQVLGYVPGNFIHSFADAHFYENQLQGVTALLERQPRPFPLIRLDPGVTNLFDFRPHHFVLEEYDPLPHIKIPFAP